MEEYDIQLYFRRAKGGALVLGDPGARAAATWPTGCYGPVEEVAS